MCVCLFTDEALTLTQALKTSVYCILQSFKKEFHTPHPLLSFLRSLSTYYLCNENICFN